VGPDELASPTEELSSADMATLAVIEGELALAHLSHPKKHTGKVIRIQKATCVRWDLVFDHRKRRKN